MIIRWVICAAVALSVIGLFATIARGDVSGYHYTCNVTVTNTGASDWSGRVTVTMPTNTMINNGYMQADADDATVVFGSEGFLTVPASVSGSSIWRLEHTTIPAGSSITETLYFGDPSATRDQWWIASSSDSAYADDSDSLDIVNAGIVFTSLYLYGTPSATQTIVSKTGNYYLEALPSGDLRWKVYRRGVMMSMPAFPDANGHVTNLTVIGSGTHYGAVATPDGDTSYVTNASSTNYVWDYLHVPDAVSTLLQGSGRINAVTVYATMRDLKPSYSGTASLAVYRDGISVTSGPITLTNTYTLYSASLGRPGGGDWTPDDFKDLEIGIGLTGLPSIHVAKCTWACLQVTYFSNDGPYSVTVPISPGTPHNVAALFDGTQIGLIVDAASQYSALSGTLNASYEELRVAECNGRLNDVYIYNNGSFGLKLQFEGDQITSGTIADQSGNGNTVYYTLGSTPSITASVGSAESTVEVGLSAYIEPPAAGVMPPISTTLDEADDNPGQSNPFYPLIVMMHQMTNIPIWLLWILAYLVTMIVSVIMVLRYVPHTAAAAGAALIVTMAFYVIGHTIPWWLMALAVMAGLASVIMERKGQV